MERTKKISTQTLAIAILTLLLVASLIMGATGAWFVDDTDTDYSGTFGIIELEDIAAEETETTVFGIDPADPNEVVMPGDTVDVKFLVKNTGTALAWVRFKLDIVVTSTAIDPETEEPIIIDGDVISTAIFGALGSNWVKAAGDYYYLNGLLTPPLDTTTTASGTEYVGNSILVDTQFRIGGDLPQSYEGASVSFVLAVDAVQVVHNGMPAAPTWGADNTWPV